MDTPNLRRATARPAIAKPLSRPLSQRTQWSSLDHRQHRLGLGLVPLKRADHERNPSWLVSRPMVI
jgi:hypothetical protein